MKKIVLKIKKDPANIVKETPEARFERIRTQRTYTRIEESKKSYKRNRDKDIINDYEI